VQPQRQQPQLTLAGVPSDHAERCLGHVICAARGTYASRAFSEQKRAAFERLAARVERIEPGRQRGAVVRLSIGTRGWSKGDRILDRGDSGPRPATSSVWTIVPRDPSHDGSWR
jgi:hypothetical protein